MVFRLVNVEQSFDFEQAVIAYADPVSHLAPTTSTAAYDNPLTFSFLPVARKKVTAAFDGGRIASDAGIMLLAMADGALSLGDHIERYFPDNRDPLRTPHTPGDNICA